MSSPFVPVSSLPLDALLRIPLLPVRLRSAHNEYLTPTSRPKPVPPPSSPEYPPTSAFLEIGVTKDPAHATTFRLSRNPRTAYATLVAHPSSSSSSPPSPSAARSTTFHLDVIAQDQTGIVGRRGSPAMVRVGAVDHQLVLSAVAEPGAYVSARWFGRLLTKQGPPRSYEMWDVLVAAPRGGVAAAAAREFEDAAVALARAVLALPGVRVRAGWKRGAVWEVESGERETGEVVLRASGDAARGEVYLGVEDGEGGAGVVERGERAAVRVDVRRVGGAVEVALVRVEEGGEREWLDVGAGGGWKRGWVGYALEVDQYSLVVALERTEAPEMPQEWKNALKLHVEAMFGSTSPKGGVDGKKPKSAPRPDAATPATPAETTTAKDAANPTVSAGKANSTTPTQVDELSDRLCETSITVNAATEPATTAAPKPVPVDKRKRDDAAAPRRGHPEKENIAVSQPSKKLAESSGGSAPTAVAASAASNNMQSGNLARPATSSRNKKKRDRQKKLKKASSSGSPAKKTAPQTVTVEPAEPENTQKQDNPEKPNKPAPLQSKAFDATSSDEIPARYFDGPRGGSSLPCYACNGNISGAYTTTGGKAYHSHCFKCTLCREPFPPGTTRYRTTEFGVSHGSPVCDSCYATKVAPRCARCSQPILGSVTSAMNKVWHPQCLTCAGCGQAVTETFWLYATKPNEPWCSNCTVGDSRPAGARRGRVGTARPVVKPTLGDLGAGISGSETTMGRRARMPAGF